MRRGGAGCDGCYLPPAYSCSLRSVSAPSVVSPDLLPFLLVWFPPFALRCFRLICSLFDCPFFLVWGHITVTKPLSTSERSGVQD